MLRIVTLLAVLGVASLFEARGATVLRLGDSSGVAGATVAVPLRFESDVAVVALQVDLAFDPAAVTGVFAQAGAGLTGHGVDSANVEAGVQRIVVHSRSNATLPNEVLAQLSVALSENAAANRMHLSLLRAILSDADGNRKTILFAPSIRLLGVTSGQVINAQPTVAISAVAIDGDGAVTRVEYHANGTKIGQSTGDPFTFNWTMPGAGRFTLTAIAFDDSGLSTATAPVNVTATGITTTAIKAKYAGLVESDPFLPAASGNVALATTAKGTASGKLTIGGVTYSVKGTLSPTGEFLARIKRRNLPDLVVTLQLGAINSSDEIFGTVKTEDGTITASIVADRAVWNKKTNPAPQAGKYTMLLTPDEADAGAGIPTASGYGLVTVGKDGSVKFSGALPDGTGISQGSFLSKDGEWPLYLGLYKKKGQLAGAVQFRDVPEVSDLDGDAEWVKESGAKSKLYTAPFATTVQVAGSLYTPPDKRLGETVLELSQTLTQGNVDVFFNDGGLADELPFTFTLTPANKVQLPSPNPGKLKVSLKLGTGFFSGSFLHPATLKPAPFSGVLIEKQNFGEGFFKTATETGLVELVPKE